jgi:ABC-type branched-subunit amino acid transport system substrate-binding protein
MSPLQIRRRSFLKGIGAATAVSGTLGLPSILKASDTIKVGLLAPLSGALAFVGQTNRNCLTLAVQEVNAAGGILGRRVEIVVEDGQMSTKVTVDKARKLIASDNVLAITGMVLPSEREAVLQAAATAQRLVIHPNNDEGRCHPNLLTTGLSPNQSVDLVVPWLAKNVGKRVYFIASDIGTYRDVAAPYLKTRLEQVGATLVGAQFFPFGTRDYGPALQQIRGENVDIVWHLIGDDPNTLVKQYKSFGMKPVLVSQIAHESQNVATDGAATGVIGVSTYFMSLQNSANKKFLDSYTAQFSDFTPRRVGSNVVMQPHGENTYAGMKILAEAARIAGSLEFAKLKDALGKVSIDLPRGPIRVAAAESHLLARTYIGRARSDNAFDILADLDPVHPTCI